MISHIATTATTTQSPSVTPPLQPHHSGSPLLSALPSEHEHAHNLYTHVPVDKTPPPIHLPNSTHLLVADSNLPVLGVGTSSPPLFTQHQLESHMQVQDQPGPGGLHVHAHVNSYVMATANSVPYGQHQADSHTHLQELVQEDPAKLERDLTSYGVPGINLDPSERSVPLHSVQEKSDIFAGTSQAYGGATTEHREHYAQPRSGLSHEPLPPPPVALERIVDDCCHGNEEEYQLSDARLDVLSPSLQQMGLRQLGILFKARGRHIAELTQQISAQAEDNERHVRILRQEKVHVQMYNTPTVYNVCIHVRIFSTLC